MKQTIEARVAQIHALFQSKEATYREFQKIADEHEHECECECGRCVFAEKISKKYDSSMKKQNAKLNAAIGKLHKKLDQLVSKAAN